MVATIPASREPLVSVVTPLYNAEPYLAQCAESVLAQTYPRWDYTIVNNCSTDRSLEIAEGFAALDPRIRVVSNHEFLDQVPNLNRALSLISAESKYCKMVLADDWMFPRCLEEMVRVAEAHPSVGLVSAYRLDERRVNCDGLPYPNSCVSGRAVCRATLLEDLFVFGTPNTVLYRSDLVRERQPFFDASCLHEDTEACYELLWEHDLGYVHQVLTFTRRQNESLTAARRVHDPQHLLDRLITVLKFGPRFLSAEEFEQCRARAESDYYQFVASRALHRAPAAFWQYHRQAFAPIGYGIRRGHLARQMVATVLRRITHPWPAEPRPRPGGSASLGAARQA